MILVTGANGHIGNVLVRELVKCGEAVRALVMPGEDCTPLEGLEVEMVRGDILNMASIEQALEGVEQVYHLAGVISIMPGKCEVLRRVNIEGTQNILRAAAQAGIKRLLYTSSIHAIQRAPDGVVIDEKIPFDPYNTCGEYDRSKAEASLAVLNAALEGLDVVIVCPTGVLGPYDYRGSEMGELIRGWMKEKLHFLVAGYYDFVDVRDVARGMILAMEKGRKGETYILSGERISVEKLRFLVVQLTKQRSFKLVLPLRIARFFSNFTPLFYRISGLKPRFTPYSIETLLSNSFISHAKAQRELGYKPRSLNETMADTVYWWAERMGLIASARSKA